MTERLWAISAGFPGFGEKWRRCPCKIGLNIITENCCATDKKNTTLESWPISLCRPGKWTKIPPPPTPPHPGKVWMGKVWMGKVWMGTVWMGKVWMGTESGNVGATCRPPAASCTSRIFRWIGQGPIGGGRGLHAPWRVSSIATVSPITMFRVHACPCMCNHLFFLYPFWFKTNQVLPARSWVTQCVEGAGQTSRPCCKSRCTFLAQTVVVKEPQSCKRHWKHHNKIRYSRCIHTAPYASSLVCDLIVRSQYLPSTCRSFYFATTLVDLHLYPATFQHFNKINNYPFYISHG